MLKTSGLAALLLSQPLAAFSGLFPPPDILDNHYSSGKVGE